MSGCCGVQRRHTRQGGRRGGLLSCSRAGAWAQLHRYRGVVVTPLLHVVVLFSLSESMFQYYADVLLKPSKFRVTSRVLAYKRIYATNYHLPAHSHVFTYLTFSAPSAHENLCATFKVEVVLHSDITETEKSIAVISPSHCDSFFPPS